MCSPRVGIEFLEFLQVLELLGGNGYVTLARRACDARGIIADVVNHKHTSVREAVFGPFDMPSDIWTVAATVSGSIAIAAIPRSAVGMLGVDTCCWSLLLQRRA